MLADGWHSEGLRNGAYEIEVRLIDTQGNRSASRWPFVVAN
jgi:hypothetical protein